MYYDRLSTTQNANLLLGTRRCHTFGSVHSTSVVGISTQLQTEIGRCLQVKLSRQNFGYGSYNAGVPIENTPYNGLYEVAPTERGPFSGRIGWEG